MGLRAMGWGTQTDARSLPTLSNCLGYMRSPAPNEYCMLLCRSIASLEADSHELSVNRRTACRHGVLEGTNGACSLRGVLGVLLELRRGTATGGQPRRNRADHVGTGAMAVRVMGGTCSVRWTCGLWGVCGLAVYPRYGALLPAVPRCLVYHAGLHCEESLKSPLRRGLSTRLAAYSLGLRSHTWGACLPLPHPAAGRMSGPSRTHATVATCNPWQVRKQVDASAMHPADKRSASVLHTAGMVRTADRCEGAHRTPLPRNTLRDRSRSSAGTLQCGTADSPRLTQYRAGT